MATTVVSFLETFNHRRVAKPDLPPGAQCQIVAFMKHDLKIGALVRELRKAQGMTVQDLADLLAVEKGTVSKKETGQLSFDDAELERIAKRFGTEPWKLYARACGVPLERLAWNDAYESVSEGLRADVISMAQARQGAGRKARE